VAVVGLEFQVRSGNAVSETKKLTTATQQLEGAVNNTNNRLRDANGRYIAAGRSAAGASNGIRAFGASAIGASGGVKALGAAIQSALGPIALLTAAAGALSAGFQVIATQDFAEAKVRSLGTSSADLVKELKKVSSELGGQASVVELTAAAYDVASAGFVKAADAAMVLKAASLGATGGFSDINTVGNAATSVLNAYGLSADNAATLVDRFIQTQNDGKIVIGEYANNIGKVASAAAGLGIPLEEINAIIAQSTAAGNGAEVAFTGIKTALAALASGTANKALGDLGIKVTSASLASDGLIGTLKKIKASGADVGKVFEALGSEAAPALLPVLNNLERTDQLLKNQINSGGAAAAAQKEAANTIQGALKAVQTEFENFFSNQSAAGAVAILTFQVLAEAIKGLGMVLEVLLAPIKATFEALQTIDSALNFSSSAAKAQQQFERFSSLAGASLQGLNTDLEKIGSNLLTELVDALDPIKQKWTEFQDFAGKVFKSLIDGWSDMNQQSANEWAQTSEFIKSNASALWDAIANGVSGIIAPIANAFKTAFNVASNIISKWYKSLPAWIRGALEGAVSVAAGVGKAVQNAVGQIGNALQKAGASIQSGANTTVGETGNKPLDYNSNTNETTADDGGKDKNKKKSPADKAAKEAARRAEEIKKQLEAAYKLNALAAADLDIQMSMTKEETLQGQFDKAALERRVKFLELQKNAKSESERQTLASAQLSEILIANNQYAKDRKTLLEQQLKPLQDIITANKTKLEDDKAYQRLIAEGINPEIAKQYVEIDRAGKALQESLQPAIDLAKAAVVEAEARGASADEVARLRKELEELQKLPGKKVEEAKGTVVPEKPKSFQEGVTAERDKIKKELDELTKASNLVAFGAKAIGDSFANSFKGIVSGAMGAKEALASFFKGVADAFLDMAAQIIAKWITMTILNTVLALFPGGGGGGLANKGGAGFDMGAINNTGMKTFNPGNKFKFAEGGFVTGPTNAIIGEGGQPEYVIPASKMRESMGRYAAGARGSAVIGSGNGTSDSGGGTATMTGSSIDVRYTVERINSVDYVTADQFQQGMQKAAMEGAQRGQQATLRRLQNSSSTRRSVGI
jgi:TP901 family phage tail tape measure protein